MFLGLASFEVVALAADHWFGSLEKSTGQFFLGFASYGLFWVNRDHDLDTEQLLLMEWYSHIQRLRARRRPLRP